MAWLGLPWDERKLPSCSAVSSGAVLTCVPFPLIRTGKCDMRIIKIALVCWQTFHSIEARRNVPQHLQFRLSDIALRSAILIRTAVCGEAKSKSWHGSTDENSPLLTNDLCPFLVSSLGKQH